MAMENEMNADPYAVVLADLRAKRNQIDQAISAIEALRIGPHGSPTPPGATGAAATPKVASDRGALLGMSIADAAKKILAGHRAQLTTPEIVSALEAGGVVLNSADKNNTVGSLLLRRFYNVGDIVRVNRGVWGLQEWYPGRKFAKGSKIGEERETSVSKELSGVAVAEQDEAAFDLTDFAPQPDMRDDDMLS